MINRCVNRCQVSSGMFLPSSLREKLGRACEIATASILALQNEGPLLKSTARSTTACFKRQRGSNREEGSVLCLSRMI